MSNPAPLNALPARVFEPLNMQRHMNYVHELYSTHLLTLVTRQQCNTKTAMSKPLSLASGSHDLYSADNPVFVNSVHHIADTLPVTVTCTTVKANGTPIYKIGTQKTISDCAGNVTLFSALTANMAMEPYLLAKAAAPFTTAAYFLVPSGTVARIRRKLPLVQRLPFRNDQGTPLVLLYDAPAVKVKDLTQATTLDLSSLEQLDPFTCGTSSLLTSGTVAGRQASILLDSGASGSVFVHERFVWDL